MASGNFSKFASILLAIFAVVALVTLGASAQTPPAPSDPAENATSGVQVAPVIVDGVTLFRVRGISAFPAERRAQQIADRIQALAADPAYSRQSLRLENTPEATRILAGQQMVMAVFDADARIEGVERQTLASAYLVRTGDAFDTYRLDRSPENLLRHAVYATLSTLLLILVIWSGRRLRRKLDSALERRYKAKVHGLQIQSFHVLHAEKVWRLVTGAFRVLWVLVLLFLVYLNLHYVLSLFPWTRGFAGRLLGLLISPVITIGQALFTAIPDLLFLAVLVVATWYILKLIRLFFSGIETGVITFSGFDPAWAKPTYRLVRLAVVAFALVAAYPYIPGSNSGAFKGVSLLIGVIFSLGSTALIGNMVSGYSMTYRRLFKQGDRIKIGAHIGDVEEIKMMVTYLRTLKNEIVAVPNSSIINSEVVNYTALAKSEGLILHTTVGIGYETSWRQVEAMLLRAAELTPGLLREPTPYVLQKALGDFAVTYEINAYCSAPRSMDRLYTALHQNILDVFNDYGVQIMTPAYEQDPEQPKVVPKDQWYAAPAQTPNALTVAAAQQSASSTSPPATGT